MRRSWPADFVSLRQAAVESAVLTVGGLLVAVLLTQRSYEAAVTIDQALIAQQGVARIVEAARALSIQDPEGRPVRLGATVLGPDKVRVVCRSEDARRAQQACAHVATEATRSQSARIDFARSSSLAPDRTLWLVLLAPLGALAWLTVRLYQRFRGHRAQDSDELQEWNVLRGALSEPSSVPHFAPSFRAPAHAARRAAAVPGTAAVARAIAFKNAELVEDSEEPHAATEIPPRARYGGVVPAAESDSRVGLRTKMVYRVGANPFRPDRSVLTQRTLTQLREQCSIMLRSAGRYQVIRVTSDVGSRYAKTQTAAQLACLLANEDETRVLLLEADSDAPALHKALRIEAPVGLGFSEQLMRLRDQGMNGTLSVIRVEGNFHALIESRISSPAALGLELFADALAELRKVHEFIVVDGPVIDVWPDAAHLAQSMDAVVLVTAAGTRAQDPLTLAARHFPADTLLSVIAAGDWSATG